MKRRFNSLPIVLFSLLSGLLGLGLQFWQQQTGIDPDGLLIPVHPVLSDNRSSSDC